MTKVSMEQITAGVMAYFESEVQPLLPNDGLPGFGVGFISTLVAARSGAVIKRLLAHPAIAMLEVADENGMIDIDELYDAAMAAMPESGVQINVLQNTIRFQRGDVKRLREMIVKQ